MTLSEKIFVEKKKYKFKKIKNPIFILFKNLIIIIHLFLNKKKNL